MNKPKQEYKKWYHTKRWERRARLQLKMHPLCKMCLQKNKIEPATIADHIIPHRGVDHLFWFGELQSLCAYHHSSHKQIYERTGIEKNYMDDIGLDGWPTDRDHPVYGKKNG